MPIKSIPFDIAFKLIENATAISLESHSSELNYPELNDDDNEDHDHDDAA